MDANLFLNQTPDVLALCKTTLDYSIDSGNFSVKGCLPLIQKDSATHMDGLAFYMKEVLPPRKLSGFLFMFLAGVTSFSVLLSFPSNDHLCLFVYTISNAISSNTDEVLRAVKFKGKRCMTMNFSQKIHLV